MISRRRFLQLGISSGLATLAGCNRSRNDEAKPLRVSVTNVTDESHTVDLSISHDNDGPFVEQQVEIAAAEPNDGTVVHTVAWVVSYPQSVTLQVQSTLDGDVTNTTSVTIDCDSDFDGGNIIIRIHDEKQMTISESCFSFSEKRENSF